MKKSYLFPNYFKKIGWGLFCLCVLYYLANWILESTGNYKSFLDFNFKWIGVVTCRGNFDQYISFFKIAKTNFMATGFPVFSTLSLLFIGFSREKIEDEYLSKIREKCLIWAIIFNSFLFMLINLLVFGMVYLDFMMIYIYFFLLTFIIKFHYELYRFKKLAKNEE